MSPHRENSGHKAARGPERTHVQGATILLVEDEKSVRKLVALFLSAHGFKVLAAEHGHSALQLWAEHKNEIDLVLTDLVMPGKLSGREVANRLRAERPDLKVLYTSGYSAELADTGLADEEICFLQKPYHPEQLLAVVRALLANGPNPIKNAYAETSSR
jgi:CheY-like chemotaxis protein